MSYPPPYGPPEGQGYPAQQPGQVPPPGGYGGYPPQPPGQGWQAPPGPASSNNTRIIVTIIAIVAVIFVTGGTLYATGALGGGGPGSADPTDSTEATQDTSASESTQDATSPPPELTFTYNDELCDDVDWSEGLDLANVDTDEIESQYDDGTYGEMACTGGKGGPYGNIQTIARIYETVDDAQTGFDEFDESLWEGATIEDISGDWDNGRFVTLAESEGVFYVLRVQTHNLHATASIGIPKDNDTDAGPDVVKALMSSVYEATLAA